MNNGKYQANRPMRRKSWKTALPLILALLVLTISAGGTLAYIMDKTAGVENTFTPAQVSCQVNDGGTVTNTSNIKAYVRAVVVANWMDNKGNVYGIAPNVTVSSSGWTLDNGIYYYNGILNPNGQEGSVTTALSAASNDPAPEGYSLVVEIVAEAIQAEGMNATGAMDAWVKAQQPIS